MNFTVDWLPEAENQLMILWTTASDRAAVTTTAQRIDQMLGYDPLDAGESREDSIRVLFVPPLGVVYWVDEPMRLVQVTSVGWSGRPV